VVKARVHDIGPTGVLLRTRRAFKLGSQVDVDIEVVMPMQVRLGFDLDALVIDGPPVTHFVRVVGIVRRCTHRADNGWEIGVEFAESVDPQELQVVELYLTHLRDGDEGHLLP
jgi:hypothetical protein